LQQDGSETANQAGRQHALAAKNLYGLDGKETDIIEKRLGRHGR
jgi:hypothetical protein